jgi:hypothetical protein
VPPVVDFSERLAAREAALPRASLAALDLDGQPGDGHERAQVLIYAVAGELSKHIDAVAPTLARRVVATEKRLVDREDPTIAALVSGFAHSTVGAVLAALAYGSFTDWACPTDGSLALFERLAERDDGLAIALRAHRLLNSELWHTWAELTDEMIEDRSLHRIALSMSTRQMAAYTDSVCEHLTRAWTETRRRRRHGIDVSVQALVRRALCGSPVAAQAALADLGYTAEDVHLAIALPLASDQDEVEALARRLRLACAATTLVVDGPEVTTIWLGFGRSATAANVDRTRMLIDLAGPVGLGDVAAGVDGFRRTRQQAADALRMAALDENPGITKYRDVALLAVLCADESRARELARAELGPLAADDDVAVRLRETVRAYLTAGESQVVTARRLFIHEKTVKYRLTQAEQLLGCKISDRRSELGAALMVHRAFEAKRRRPQ